MTVFLLTILLVVTLLMIGVILLQRSEGGGLGIGGGNMGGMMTARGTSDLLTRTTAILATIFMGLCLLLAILSGYNAKKDSLLAKIATEEEVEVALSQQAGEGTVEAPTHTETVAPVATSAETPVSETKKDAEATAPVV